MTLSRPCSLCMALPRVFSNLAGRDCARRDRPERGHVFWTNSARRPPSRSPQRLHDPLEMYHVQVYAAATWPQITISARPVPQSDTEYLAAAITRDRHPDHFAGILLPLRDYFLRPPHG